MPNSNLVIIGSGPAAWTAAIYAARAALSPVVLTGEQGGGQLMLTTKVENYPGFPDGILGPDLMTAMRQQAEKQGVKIVDKNAVKLIKSETGFVVVYGSLPEHSENSESENPALRFSDSPTLRNSESSEFSESVIIATGAVANTLKLPGEDRLMGRGVGTCAVCDAPFYRGKNTAFVIGGGDSAAEEAAELAKFVNKVIILVRKDTMKATAVMQNRIKSLQNIEIWYNSQAKEFFGEKQLEKLKITRNNQEEVLPADGVFYAIGHTPATGWLKGSGVEVDEKGYILTPLSKIMLTSEKSAKSAEISSNQIIDKSDKSDLSDLSAIRSGSPQAGRADDGRFQPTFPTMTNIPGVFAAGDCVDRRYRQAITAAGYGCMAALDAQKWLEHQ